MKGVELQCLCLLQLAHRFSQPILSPPKPPTSPTRDASAAKFPYTLHSKVFHAAKQHTSSLTNLRWPVVLLPNTPQLFPDLPIPLPVYLPTTPTSNQQRPQSFPLQHLLPRKFSVPKTPSTAYPQRMSRFLPKLLRTLPSVPHSL